MPSLLLMGMLLTAMGIDLNNLLNYASQSRPVYIVRDNTMPANPITDAGATLGRVLFYDKELSVNRTVSCASCHQQQFAFSDTARLSKGLDGGLTGRHSMRLVNARFSQEMKFFWDERANSLEDQVTRPVQDHIEMGFSGTNGYPAMDSLIRRVRNIDYYQRLFYFVYGDSMINEQRIKFALAQFVRSIQSFDSKFDAGRAQVANVADPFPNYTQQENQGKQIFLTAPGGPNGGMGCQGCHRAPEFDIDPASLNNGVIADAQNPSIVDLANTRSPSLRDLVNSQGLLNGPMMHNGNFNTIRQVLNHYNQVPPNPANTNLDPRVAGPNGNGQSLNMTPQQLDAVEAFLRTLSGSQLYTDVRWSDPFDANGDLTVLPLPSVSAQAVVDDVQMRVYPNPASDRLFVDLPSAGFTLTVHAQDGHRMLHTFVTGSSQVRVSDWPAGIYILQADNAEDDLHYVKKFIIK